ncbi:MAG TPA: glycosyltransferase family 39 protein [Pyrinomonadaceae bacterium]|nr:glycosyltransferase family 39 protein [Pyrinomonadaceae bacterium]
MTSSVETDAPSRVSENASSLSFLLFLFVVVIYVAARLWRLTSSCLWFDELFGVHAARHDWKHMLQFVAADLIHPPLFYSLLKIWIAIGGESLLWLRLLPVLISVAAIVPIVLLCRALKLNAWQLNLALALLAVNGYLIKYAQEVRMYSLLFLLTCTSLWLFVRFIDSTGRVSRVLPALAAVNLLLIYSHYYGWVVVLVELVFVMLWRRDRASKLRLTTLALGFSYLPWLYLITLAKEPGRGLAQNIGWVSRPGLRDLGQFFALLNTPFFFRQSSGGSLNDIWSFTLSLVLFGVPLALLFREVVRRKRSVEREAWILLGLFVLPIVLVLILSWVLPYSVWGTRHLIITAAPYAILAAIALNRLRLAWLRTTCLALIAGWVLLNGVLTLVVRPTNFTWCTWEPLAQQVVQVETSNTQPVHVYAFEDLVAYHLWFAFEDAAKRSGGTNNFRVHVAKGIPGLREDPAYFLPRRFYEIETQDGATFRGDTIWLAFRASQWNPGQPPLSLIAPQGFETGRIFQLRAQGQESVLVELRRKAASQ